MSTTNKKVYTTEEKMIFIVSEMKHFILATELIHLNFIVIKNQHNVDKHFLFGLLVTSWSTHFRCLHDFFYLKSKKKNSDIQLKHILSKHYLDEFIIKRDEIQNEIDSMILTQEEENNLNDSVEGYIHECADEVFQFNNSRLNNIQSSRILKTKDFISKLDKVVFHLTVERIDIFEEFFAWPTSLYFEFICRLYNCFIKYLEIEDPEFINQQKYEMYDINYSEELQNEILSDFIALEDKLFSLVCRKKVYDLL
jgi:hypothetical protein